MKSCVSILAAGVLLLSVALSLAKNFYKFEDCGKDGEKIATFEEMHLGPDPLNLKGNVTANAIVQVKEDIPEHSVIKVRDYKLSSLFGIPLEIPIPCLFGIIGSCTHKACNFLQLRKQQACPFFPPGVNCTCPVKAGAYGGHNITVPMPDLSAFARFFAKGKYRTEIKLVDELAKKELACVRVHVELK